MGGEKAVARHDEDSITMAVAATLGCIKRGGKQEDGLFFATTTSPYKEKQAASIIAAAVDMPRETRRTKTQQWAKERYAQNKPCFLSY